MKQNHLNYLLVACWSRKSWGASTNITKSGVVWSTGSAVSTLAQTAF